MTKYVKTFENYINEGGYSMVPAGSEVADVMSAIEKLVNQDITFDVIINPGSKDSKTITIHGMGKKS